MALLCAGCTDESMMIAIIKIMMTITIIITMMMIILDGNYLPRAKALEQFDIEFLLH